MLLVDEAGKAGTRNLDRLLALAAERGAVVRLVGDPQQLGSVAAGGAFRLLAHELGAAEMLDVLRFRDPEEAAASLQLRVRGPGRRRLLPRAAAASTKAPPWTSRTRCTGGGSPTGTPAAPRS